MFTKTNGTSAEKENLLIILRKIEKYDRVGSNFPEMFASQSHRKQKKRGRQGLIWTHWPRVWLTIKGFSVWKIKKCSSNLYHCYCTFMVPVTGLRLASLACISSACQKVRRDACIFGASLIEPPVLVRMKKSPSPFWKMEIFWCRWPDSNRYVVANEGF